MTADFNNRGSLITVVCGYLQVGLGGIVKLHFSSRSMGSLEVGLMVVLVRGFCSRAIFAPWLERGYSRAIFLGVMGWEM